MTPVGWSRAGLVWTLENDRGKPLASRICDPTDAPLVVTRPPGIRRLGRKEHDMDFGMTGSGGMCTKVVRRLLGAAHRCVLHDLNPDAVAALVKERTDGRTGGA